MSGIAWRFGTWWGRAFAIAAVVGGMGMISLPPQVIAAGLSWADRPPANLDSLTAAALAANPRVHSLEAAHRAALERIPQAGALPDPMLLYTAEGAPIDDPSPTSAMTRKIELSEMVPFPGKRGLARSAMSQEAEMARSELDRARLEVAADIRKAYFDLHLLAVSIDIINENQAALRSFAEIARTKYEVGSAGLQDVLKANVELAQETNRLTILEARIPAAIARVNAVLNQPSDHPVGRPAIVLPDGPLPDIASPDSLEASALAAQPMLRMKELAIRRNEYGVRLARATGLPDFTLGAEYMSIRDATDAWSLMLGMSLPIWRWNKVAPARREAEQTLISSRADLDEARNEVRSEVRDATAMVTTQRSLVNLYRTSVLPLAEQSLASARAAYENNKVEFLNLLDSQRSLLQFRLEYQEALTEYLKSQADLALVVGDLRLLGVSP